MTRPITMPQQVRPPAPIGSLLKKRGPLQVRERRTPYRVGREIDASYLVLIRQLPCLKCGMEPCGEAAHVRRNSAAHGKYQAKGAKPDDRWALPLCSGCHRQDPDSQHRIGEDAFWDRVGLDPLRVCELLWQAPRDVVAMRAVVFTFIAGRKT